MPQTPLSTPTIRKLLHRSAADNFNKAQTARALRISRSSATKYIAAFKRSPLTLSEINSMPRAKLIDRLFPKSKPATPSHRKLQLLARLPSIHSRIEIDGLSVLEPASKVPIRRQRPLFESDSRRSTPALGTTQFAPQEFPCGEYRKRWGYLAGLI